MDEALLKKRIFSLISLIFRAGFLKTGEEKCEKTLRDGEAKLIIISGDASANTKKKFLNKAFYYNVPVVTYGFKQELGKLAGREAVSSLCVTDNNLSVKLKKMIELSYENLRGE